MFFDQMEKTTLAAPFKLTLVGKFSHWKPSIEVLLKEFHTVSFKGSFSVGWLDPRHVLVHFDLEEDYMRVFMKGMWNFKAIPYGFSNGLWNFKLRQKHRSCWCG